MSKRKALRTATPIRRRSALMVSAAAVALMGLPFSALAEPGAARLPRGEDVIREPQATFPVGQVRLPRGEDVVREPQAQASLAPHALPRDPNVVAGGATFDENGARLDVNQSTDRVVIDWRSFDIGQDAEVNFYQPGTSAIAVNRISSGGLPSQIAGVLRANGTVVILNPNGVIFSATSRVDVGGLVASTGRIDVDQFMAGGNRFDFTDATSGSIVAGGSINIAEAGLAAFVAPHVRNDGVINARLGRVALAAGETFTLDLAGDRLIELGLGAHTPLVENYGSILVDGGRIQLSAVAAGAVVDQVINAGGLISVASAHDDGGTIVLEGANGGVTVSGELNASGATGGGDIAITGATITTTADAVLNADATQAGDGGAIVAVADGRGDYAGALSARGGAAGGDGGFIETSGKTVGLDAGLRVDTSAVDGENGDWLIDPVDLVVGAGEAAAVVNNLASGNVILQAENSITVDSAIDSSAQANANTLSLNDENSDGDLTVTLNAGIRLAASQHLTGQASQVNVRNGGIIQNGVDVALAGASINVGAGDYAAGTVINKNGLTLTGEAGAVINLSPAQTGVSISADNVTVSNLTFEGPVDGNHWEIDWSNPAYASNTAIAVKGNTGSGYSNFNITDNDISNVRTGIIVQGASASGSITGNRIENTKGGILIQYNNGAGYTIAGNSQGAAGNEWGIVLNLNSTAIWNTGTASTAWQAALLALDTGNGGMSVMDRQYADANRTQVHVDAASTATAADDNNLGNGLGSQRQGLSTIQAGVNAVVSGGVVNVGAGAYVGNVLINKNDVTLISDAGRDATTIQGVAGAGSLGAVVIQNASGVTVGTTDHGFTILGFDSANPGIENGALYIQGSNSDTLIQGNRITAGGDEALMSEWSAVVDNVTVDGNIIDGKTYVGAAPATGNQFTVPNVSRQLVVMGGGGNTSNIVFTNNQVTGDSGLNTGLTIDAATATITGNTFASTTGGWGGLFRARGSNNTISGNTFDLGGLAATGAAITLGTGVASDAAAFEAVLAANGLTSNGVWAESVAGSTRGLYRNIQGAVSESAVGGTVHVMAGDYVGGAIIATNGLTLTGEAGARIVVPALASGDMNGLTISADGVTIQNLEIAGPADESWLTYGWNDAGQGGTTRGIAVWNGSENFTIQNNDIHDLRTGVVVDGRNTGSLINNVIDNTKSAISVQYTDAGLLNAEGFAVDISGNSEGQYGNEWGLNFHLNGHYESGVYFNNSQKIAANASGAVQAALLAVSAANNGMSAQDQGYSFSNRTSVNVGVGGSDANQGSALGQLATIQAGVNAVVSGGLVNVGAGTFVQPTSSPAYLWVNKTVEIAGAGQGQTIIDARGASTYGIRVQADGVNLHDFSLLGVTGSGGYGIKVEPLQTGPVDPNSRLHDFTLANVTIQGSAKTELDLNGVIGATLSNITVDGMVYGGSTLTAGNGISITDSADITLTDVTTRNNAWGGLALYQTNKTYNQQVDDISVDASNTFNEGNGVYLEDESNGGAGRVVGGVGLDYGDLNIAGYSYVVSDRSNAADIYTWFRRSESDAFNWIGLTGKTAVGTIEGWTGTTRDNHFLVGTVAGTAMSVSAAVNAARAGGVIDIHAGDYAGLVTINKSLTLSGAGMDQTRLTGGINLPNTAFSNLTLQGFTLSGDGGGNALVRNGRVTNLTVDDVRFDGGNVAGRHGFAGGQFGGAISITNSEFLGIRGWSAFDTNTGGAVGAITSVVFSDNLLDGTVGHVTFRQATPTANVLISGNTVRNVGDTTDLSSGIFKVFGAATVDFVDNEITGVGFNPTKFTAGVNDGAALLVNGVGTLNITDNVFTDNQQAFLVGAGNALPTVTNLTGNTFNNNAYDIFLPASTGGTLNFGAGNSFVSGADTVQHIVWGGAAGIDLTNVLFDGKLTSDMNLTELFALEDLVSHATDVAGVGFATFKAGEVFVTAASGSIQRGVDAAGSGDAVHVGAGTFDQALSITKDVSVLGAGAGLTIIQPTALLATGVGHKYDANMNVSVFVSGADHVVLDGLTIDGANLAGNAGVFWTNASGELRNVHITNVRPFSGVQTGQGLAVDATAGHTTDLLVSNVLFDNWNKNAIDVVTGQGAGTGGGAVNLTVSGSTFTGRGETGTNAQNGVVLWERAGGTINADIDGSSFSDLGYTGAATAAGVLVYAGLNGHTTVSNSSFDGVQTYLALDGGTLNELDAASGNVFDGVDADTATLEQLLAIEDHVDHGVDFAGNGLVRVRDGQVFVTENSDPGAITRAAGLASAGDTVNVGSGTYGETVAINKSLTLSGAGMGDTSITGGMTLTGAINGLNLSGFTITGGASAVIRGTGLSLTDLNIDDVRIDGGNVATRAGISGGQYGGDISITNSEFANIGHWVVFDTRSGSGAPGAGTEVSSFTFSGNLIDNVKGGIAVRQNDGGTGSVTIAGNTVRNIGDSTQSSGGIFKIFNAGTVDFTGNTISDIGTNASLTSDGVAYGAALLMRGVQTLNVTDNTFTNVYMAVATEKNGYSAPTLTTFTGNTFTNTGYAFFMPTDALTGGSVVFGAGNAINSGANTLQHIVWRGAAGLDLTGVMFDGKLGSDMSLAELLDLEDLITHGTDVSGAGLARVKAGEVFVTAASASVQRGIDLAAQGDIVHVGGGAYALPGELSITKSLSLLGAGAGDTVFNSTSTGYGVFVAADDVTLGGFTFNGTQAGSYGVKVQPNSADPGARVHGFTITDVAINGTRKTGLDLNGVVGAVIDGVTVTGATAGNGISITDSADVTVRDTTTSGNAWGGLALYQTNRFFDQQVGDIMVEASNVFGETRGLYTQDESAQFDFGALTLLGFAFTVRNDAFQADAAGYTFYKATLQGALDYGVALGAGDSYVEGWNGTGDTGHFHVGLGDAGAGLQALSIQTAFDKSAAGDLIDVASGDYAEVATLGGQRDLRFGVITVGGLNLTSGAAGTVLSGDVTAGAGGLDFDAFVILGGDTRLAATGGDIRLVGVDGQPGGQQSLVVDGSDTVYVGQVGASKALASLTVSGDDVTALGANTTGTQAYTGARVGLSGAFVATGGFSVAGAAELDASTSIAADGDVDLDTVNGAHDLTIDAGGAVNLGAVGATTALTSLDVSGASITSVGAVTTGAQAYDAATVGLSGAYAAGGDVTIDGATVLNGDVAVSGDDVTLASVNGAHALTIDADGAARLGAVGATTALASLDVSGASITSVGAVTTGAQTYDAATVGLSGAYAAGGDLTIDGATTLNGDVAVSGDDVTLASVNGAHALTVDADGAARLGAVGATTALTSLDVSGASITSVGARTVGGQSWTAEAIRLAGGFSTDNGDFSLTGLTTLDGATTIATAGGDIAAGAIDGSGGGGQSLSMDAGSGGVAVGSMGAGVRLGAVLVRSAGTVLNGSTYAGDSLRFQGSGAGSTVRLTQALTTFNTAPIGGAAGDIIIEPDLIGTTNGAQSVAFVAGAGLGNDGDITLGNLGTEAVRLGAMSVSGGDFNAQTVKLAGDYTAVLSGDQVFSAHTLDTLGDVNASVGGDDVGPIIAGGSVVINAGGSSSGSISAGGAVSISGIDGVDRGIVAGGSVDVASTGGSVTGSIDSGGDVGVTAFGAVDLDVDAGGSVDLTSTNSSINSVVNGGGDVSLNGAGPIVAEVTTPGAVTIGTPQLINVTVNAGSLVLNAPGGTIGGDFGSITTDPNGTFNVNGQTVVGSGSTDARQFLIDQFLAPAGGVVGSTGQIQLPVNLAVALIAPAGEGQGNRRPIIVNSVDRLGELLRLGYTAIIVQLDSGEEYEQEIDLAASAEAQPAG